MSEFTNLRDRLSGILSALAVGIPAGYLFHLLQAPIPWMIGPMIAVAVLNLAGVRMHSSPLRMDGRGASLRTGYGRLISPGPKQTGLRHRSGRFFLAKDR